jgi:ribonucleotide monophosphatase NagD (HAD superfamily)
MLSSESDREEDIASRPSGASRSSASNPPDTADSRSSKWFPGLEVPTEEGKPSSANAPSARPSVGFRPSAILIEPEGRGSSVTAGPASCCSVADAEVAAESSTDAGLPPRSPQYVLDGIKALLIDLDGTMYNPSGAIPGADAFYAYLLRRQLPFVFLSNTGAKGPHGVQSKLMSRGFMLQAAPVPTENIYTAAQAQCRYMVDHIPPGARVFVIAGGVEAHADRASIEGSWWMRLLLHGSCAEDPLANEGEVRSGAEEPRRSGRSCQRGGSSRDVSPGARASHSPAGRQNGGESKRGGSGSVRGLRDSRGGSSVTSELISSWEIRTHLSEEEAKEWSVIAAAHLEHPTVFVVLFSDGSITASVDPKTGKRGHADWSFQVIQKASYLLSHGAEFVCTAEDAFNPTKDGFPLPGPGMFSAMFRKLMYPLGRNRYRHAAPLALQRPSPLALSPLPLF